jgi:NAD(P)-dependent dehydrogenase (short-subunit alcohol dehydrogenase family)
MFDFSNQVVIITGARGNLGSAVARAFYSAGAHIVASDHSVEMIEKAFPELSNSRDHILADGIDVTNPEQVDKLVQQVLARFERIDVLVNTVGGYRAGSPLHETSLETWDFMLNLNARSAFIASRAVIPTMLKQQRGCIVNIGSHAALTPHGNDSAYSVAKSAVLRLTESIAIEYKSQGIRANAVIPSALVSPADLRADPTKGVTPDAVAQVILFLCSEAGSIINGALIPAYGLRF